MSELGALLQKVQRFVASFQVRDNRLTRKGRMKEAVMRKSIVALLISTLVLSACGSVRESRLNPFNWFGRAEAVDANAETAEEINPLIPTRGESILQREGPGYQGTIVAEVNSLRIERVAGGAIIRVTGTTATQGAYDVLLQPENEDHTAENGVLTYRLMAVQPSGFRIGSTRSREISAAVYRTDQELDSVRTIRIVGANKSLQSRR